MKKTMFLSRLQRNTIQRRTEQIGSYCELKLLEKLSRCSYFSITLDESTDVSNISQLLIFCRILNSDFSTEVELLKLVSLHGHSKAKDILIHIRALLDKMDITKMSAICSDGCPTTMIGKKDGLVGLLR